MGHGVVGGHIGAAVVVHVRGDSVANLDGTRGDAADVHDITSVGLRVHHLEASILALQGSGIIHLATALVVERSVAEHQTHSAGLGIRRVHEASSGASTASEHSQHLGLGGNVPGVLGFAVGGGDIVAGQPGSLLGLHRHVLASATLASVLRSLRDQTIVLHELIETSSVHGHVQLRSHQLGQIQRKAHTREQHVRILGRHHGGPAGLQTRHDLLEVLHALVQGTVKGLFLVGDDGFYIGLALAKLGESVAEVGHHDRHQLGEEASRRGEHLLAVAHRAAQDTAQNIAAAFVTGHGTVGDGEGQGADVVSDHSVGHVDQSDILGTKLAFVGAAVGDLSDGLEDRGEDVGVIVGLVALQNRGEALETHAGVDVLVGKLLQGTIGFAVELDEHVIPDLNHIGHVGVDQVSSVAVADAIVVDLGTRATGSGGAHLPEVLLAAACDDAVGRQEAKPDVSGLEVRLQALGGITAEVGRVKAVGVKAEVNSEALPGPSDGFLLEVITETPVTQHLEEGVMVHVLADVLKVVVLASGANALLTVHGSLQIIHLQARVACTKKQRFILVHTGVGE
mmetsp:Transcript_26999/g.46257  ORF Transcript_26999/g.46257 Transcript_26999/m.46257 type:complete len:567 (+) Transcript_26999:1285-2985(+)